MLRLTAEAFARKAANNSKAAKSKLPKSKPAKSPSRALGKATMEMAAKLAANNNPPPAPKTTKKELAEIVAKTVDDYQQFFNQGIASQQASVKAKRPTNALLQTFLRKQQQKSKLPGFKSKVLQQSPGFEFDFAAPVDVHVANTKVTTNYVPPKSSFGLYYNQKTIEAVASLENINKSIEKLNKSQVEKIYQKSIETFKNPPKKSIFEHQKTVAEQVFEIIDKKYKTEMAMEKLSQELKSVKAPKSPFWKWYEANKKDLVREGENLRLKGIQVTHHARNKYMNMPAGAKLKYEKEYLNDMINYEAKKEENALRKLAASGKTVARKPLASLYQQQQRAKLPAKNFNNYDEKKKYDADMIKKFRAEFKNLAKSELTSLEKARDAEFQQRKAKIEKLRQAMNL